LLGPSFWGALAPVGYAFLLPPPMAPYLGTIAQLGVILFMFLIGLELDTNMLRGNAPTMLTIAHMSIVVPFLLGAALAVLLYPRYATNNVSFTVFSLFLGISLAVTAFPMQQTVLGVTALTCAAIGDATAWVLLAFVSSVAMAGTKGFPLTVLFVLAYLACMFVVVRPCLVRLAKWEDKANGPLAHNVLAIVCATLLLSAAATEAIGIHALFGAFLAGVLVPHHSRLAEQVRARLEDVVVVLFLPVFFVLTGMRTQIGLLSGIQDWAICGLIIGVATLGKFGGATIAARFIGLEWRSASALGILMNTRGLMELIVLDIGLEMGVISPMLFTMLVLMALITTFLTTPLLHIISGGRGFT
jgi:Kef-type K+ transport system membrane component KefB